MSTGVEAIRGAEMSEIREIMKAENVQHTREQRLAALVAILCGEI